jgi:hypothetical protein
MSTESSADDRPTVLDRIAPLAGVLFGGLTMAGYLSIGEFPDSSTPAAELPVYYAGNGESVTLGGTLVGLAGVCFAIFGVAVWARVRRSTVPPVVAAVVLVGATVDAVFDLSSGATYQLLGEIGVDPHITPAALQAWHISGSAFGVSGGTTLFLLGIAVAGIVYRALPRGLAWTGVLLGLAPFAPHPWGFYASLAFLLWAAVAGVVLAVRPGHLSTPARVEPAPVR